VRAFTGTFRVGTFPRKRLAPVRAFTATFRIGTFPRKRSTPKNGLSGAGALFAPWDEPGSLSRAAPALKPTPHHGFGIEESLYGPHCLCRAGLGSSSTAEEPRLEF